MAFVGNVLSLNCSPDLGAFAIALFYCLLLCLEWGSQPVSGVSEDTFRRTGLDLKWRDQIPELAFSEFKEHLTIYQCTKKDICFLCKIEPSGSCTGNGK